MLTPESHGLSLKELGQRDLELGRCQRTDEDIKGLLDAHPGADLKVVRQRVKEFATGMTMPDLLDDFEKVVARRR